jgi:probable H4MPT-linked C1 transfer pathway protein
MRTVGLDIGGANLKASDGDALSVSLPFAIWRAPHDLSRRLQELLSEFGAWDTLAVTMTAELADCYATKEEGVWSILSSVAEVAAGRAVRVWQTGGEFVSLDEARELTPLVAAANWHALATWAGRMVPAGSGLLIDIGSTTSDIIPIESGVPMPEGRTDVERLLSGELVYTGVRRTPLCAMTQTVPLRGGECPLAAELFATSHDLYLLTGDIPESSDDRDTADGRPATRAAAHNRLAHQVCCDATELSFEESLAIAVALAEVQGRTISSAMARVVSRLEGPCAAVLLCGEGEFLARRVLASPGIEPAPEAISLNRLLGPAHSTAACAFALARLAQEHS